MRYEPGDDFADVAAKGGSAQRAGDKAWNKQKLTLRLEDWLARDLPKPDFLLGEWLSTTSRVLLVGPTGLGKTMFALAIALAIVSNKAFLHWRAGRRARVLYIDGEMPRRLMQTRLQDAVRRAAASMPVELFVLSKEDADDMPALNAPEGQKWMDAFILKHGPVDLIIFDNIQALLVGDMRDEEQWSQILPWVRSLTRKRTGQIWLHHTGHNENQSYGSKAREWQMDTVILMKRVDIGEVDLSFSLEFTKARERTPENRADFEPVAIKLVDDQWEYAQPSEPITKLTPNQKTMLDLLTDAMPHGLLLDEWNDKGRAEGIGARRRATLSDIRRVLKERKLVHEYAGRWFVT